MNAVHYPGSSKRSLVLLREARAARRASAETIQHIETYLKKAQSASAARFETSD